MKRLKKSLGAGLLLAFALTGMGLVAPPQGLSPAQASSAMVSLSHELRTPEAKSANRLLTNATVRLSARVEVSQASSSSAVRFILPAGLQIEQLPGHCGDSSSMTNVGQPWHTTAMTPDTWRNLRVQTVVCDLGATPRGYGNDVWIDARVRPELPPGHRFSVEAQVVTEGQAAASTQYTSLPAVHSEARTAMGPLIDHQSNHGARAWFGSGYRTAWQYNVATETRHPHPETEAAGYFRIHHPLLLTTPSQYGHQPLDWELSEISFKLVPDEVYFPGVTRTEPWQARQRSHGDAYEYYMPNLTVDTSRPSAHHTLGNNDSREAFRGGSNLKFSSDSRTQTSSLSASALDTSAWTVPIRVADGANTPLPNKESDYRGPNYEALWSRHVLVYTPDQAINDLIPYSPVKDRLHVTIPSPTFKGVGLHEVNRPWVNQAPWSITGIGRADGYNEHRARITAPGINSSPFHSPGSSFIPGFPWLWSGLPGSEIAGDGQAELMPGETMMFSSQNRMTAPVGGAAAQYQCIAWESHLSLRDPGREYVSDTGQQQLRHPSTGPVYMTTASNFASEADRQRGLRFEVQYSNTAARSGARVDCTSGTWYNNPAQVPGNDATKAREGIYTGVRQARFVVASSAPNRIETNTVVPLVATNDSYRGPAWVWNSYASRNYTTRTFDSINQVQSLNQFFAAPRWAHVATANQSPVAERAEKVTLTNPLSMVTMSAQTPVPGGQLAEVKVSPHSPSTSGPMTVRVEFDKAMVYYDTPEGPKPHQSGDGFVVYRFSNPSSAKPITMRMLTTPDQNTVTSTITATSRMPGEGSRRNNNASTNMRIDSTNPMAATLRSEQAVVDVHPFSGNGQRSEWSMNFGNLTPFHTADVTAYVLVPRKGLDGNTLSHAQADVVLGSLQAQGWTVRASTQSFNRNSTPAQLAAAHYTSLPSNRANVEVIRLTRTLTPGAEGSASIPMMAYATSGGDRITPHMIFEMKMRVGDREVSSFTGVRTPTATEVSAGTLSGTAWVDGTVADHDGAMPSSGRRAVANMPISISGTTASGININTRLQSNSVKTNGSGAWALGDLPAGEYTVKFANEKWMQDSDFTSFTRRGGSSAVGYTGSWTPNFTAANHHTSSKVTVPSVSANNRTVTANAGVIGESALTVSRGETHDYGYRSTGYWTHVTVRNDSDTFVENVNVVDRINSGGALGRTRASVLTGPGSVKVGGNSTTYTVSRLNPGQSATIQIQHQVAPSAREGQKLDSATTSAGTFYGFKAGVDESRAKYSGQVAVPVLEASVGWSDSGSWLPSISDPRTGWQTGTNAAEDAVLVEPREASKGPIAHESAESMFGPGESVKTSYTITNKSTVVPISLRQVTALFTGVDLAEERSLGTGVLQPGKSMTVSADFVEALAQKEVDAGAAEADLQVSAIAPRIKNNFSSSTFSLTEQAESFDWESWAVPVHRHSQLVLTGLAQDASGDGVVENNEDGIFTYTWVNLGNLTLKNPEFLDERTNSKPRFEDGFDGELAPGERVRAATSMPISSSLFRDGMFTNQAWSKASAPLRTDTDPEARVTTSLVQRVESGLDLEITLVDANGDGSVSLGEEFHYELQLRNNSPERYREVKMQGPVEITSGEVTYTVDVAIPESFDGGLRPGDAVILHTQKVTATDARGRGGYIDLESGAIKAQARAEGTTSTGETRDSNWAVEISSVFARPLVVSAGDGAGELPAISTTSSTGAVYAVLGGIAALVVLALLIINLPGVHRAAGKSRRQRQDKELSHV